MFSFLIASILAAQPIDSDMTSIEKKQTGVAKLSEGEKLALQYWVDNNYTKKPATSADKKPKPQGVLEENIRGGTYIRLSDGSLWNIHPSDTPITQGWITPVEIVVTQSGDPQYPYKLTNSLTGSSVKARKAEKTAPQTPSPTTQPPKK